MGAEMFSELSLNIKLYFAQKHPKSQFKMFTKTALAVFKLILKIGLGVL